MAYRDHQKLIVWQKSMKLAKDIYALTRTFPKSELFGLTSQIRRAAVSIPSNIAEGYSRHSRQEFKHYLKIAKGSAAEIQTQLILSGDLGFLSESLLKEPLHLVEVLLKMLSAFIINLDKQGEKECKKDISLA